LNNQWPLWVAFVAMIGSCAVVFSEITNKMAVNEANILSSGMYNREMFMEVKASLRRIEDHFIDHP